MPQSEPTHLFQDHPANERPSQQAQVQQGRAGGAPEEEAARHDGGGRRPAAAVGRRRLRSRRQLRGHCWQGAGRVWGGCAALGWRAEDRWAAPGAAAAKTPSGSEGAGEWRPEATAPETSSKRREKETAPWTPPLPLFRAAACGTQSGMQAPCAPAPSAAATPEQHAGHQPQPLPLASNRCLRLSVGDRCCAPPASMSASSHATGGQAMAERRQHPPSETWRALGLQRGGAGRCAGRCAARCAARRAALELREDDLKQVCSQDQLLVLHRLQVLCTEWWDGW